MTSSGSSSSSGDGEFDDGGGDIRSVVRELDVASQALRDECLEAEWLRECLLATEMVLGAADEEAAMARAVAAAAQAELAGMSNSIFPVF